MNHIHLNLKSKWFDMIFSGEKIEEYREIKPFFQKMFCYSYYPEKQSLCRKSYCEYCKIPSEQGLIPIKSIIFSNGYAKTRRQFEIELKQIDIKRGKVEWGASPTQKYFVLTLGKIINKNF